MTTEDRFASLERRIASLERTLLPMTPFGPNPAQDADLELRRDEAVALLRDALIAKGIKPFAPAVAAPTETPTNCLRCLGFGKLATNVVTNGKGEVVSFDEAPCPECHGTGEKPR